MTFFSFNPLSINYLECVTMNNQEGRPRTKIIDINNNESVFYHFSVKLNKHGRICNIINDPYAKLCVAIVVKNINLRVFDIVSNQTRVIME